MLSDKGSPRGFEILMWAVLVGRGRIEVPRGVGEWAWVAEMWHICVCLLGVLLMQAGNADGSLGASSQKRPRSSSEGYAYVLWLCI